MGELLRVFRTPAFTLASVLVISNWPGTAWIGRTMTTVQAAATTARLPDRARAGRARDLGRAAGILHYAKLEVAAQIIHPTDLSGGVHVEGRRHQRHRGREARRRRRRHGGPDLTGYQSVGRLLLTICWRDPAEPVHIRTADLTLSCRFRTRRQA